MTSFDYLVLAILVISAGLGLMRGFIKEVLSLAAYVVAFVSAIWWGPWLSDRLSIWVTTDILRTAVAYGLVFIIVLLLVGIVNLTLATLIDKTGLSPADHGLGALFGLLRGLLFVLLLVIVAGYTDLPKESWWADAQFSRPAIQAVQQIKVLLPPSLAAWLPY